MASFTKARIARDSGVPVDEPRRGVVLAYTRRVDLTPGVAERHEDRCADTHFDGTLRVEHLLASLRRAEVPPCSPCAM